MKVRFFESTGELRIEAIEESNEAKRKGVET